MWKNLDLLLMKNSLYQHSQDKLIEHCIENKREAQEFLYKRYFQTLYIQCKKYCSDDEDVISIINDGMLKAYKNLQFYQNKGSLEGWLRKIVFHTLADHFRKENRRLKFLEVEEAWTQKATDLPTDNLEMEYLLGLIENLPDITRSVFIKFAIEGYNHKEIGEIMGMAEGTSKWHLSKAREKLKEVLHKEDQRNANAK